MAQLLPLLLCGALLFAATPPARGHRPLLTSPVGGAAYSTWDAALPVPWVNSSWAVKRVVEASNERLPGDSRVPLLLARCPTSAPLCANPRCILMLSRCPPNGWAVALVLAPRCPSAEVRRQSRSRAHSVLACHLISRIVLNR